MLQKYQRDVYAYLAVFSWACLIVLGFFIVMSIVNKSDKQNEKEKRCDKQHCEHGLPNLVGDLCVCVELSPPHPE